MIDVWQACSPQVEPGALSGTLLRLVESQEDIATLALVSTLEEQAELERLLEESKPPLPDGCARLHYLLATPFRYPPLRHGSRFGTRFEPSLFYGSRRRETVLAEAAFYRFVFWFGMRVPPPNKLVTAHAMFSARYRTAQGLALHAAPFDAFRDVLASRSDYAVTQQLGRDMRAAGVEAFEFVSARDPAGGSNVALFSARALATTRPGNSSQWLCETDGERVAFVERGTPALSAWQLAVFLVEGVLPAPAG